MHPSLFLFVVILICTNNMVNAGGAKWYLNNPIDNIKWNLKLFFLTMIRLVLYYTFYFIIIRIMYIYIRTQFYVAGNWFFRFAEADFSLTWEYHQLLFAKKRLIEENAIKISPVVVLGRLLCTCCYYQKILLILLYTYIFSPQQPHIKSS